MERPDELWYWDIGKEKACRCWWKGEWKTEQEALVAGISLHSSAAVGGGTVLNEGGTGDERMDEEVRKHVWSVISIPVGAAREIASIPGEEIREVRLKWRDFGDVRAKKMAIEIELSPAFGASGNVSRMRFIGFVGKVEEFLEE